MTLLELDAVEHVAIGAGEIGHFQVAYASRADGSRATFPLIMVQGRTSGPTVVLVGGIHGDEYEGPRALWQLADWAAEKPLAGRLLIVPMANLDAFSAGTRTSPTDLQNLARIFPGDPLGTLTFRLADALFRIVRMGDLLVDLHSGGVRLAFLEVCGFYGEAPGISAETAARSLALARAIGLRHLWRLPARQGVLSFEAMRIGVPAIGAESGGRGGQLGADVAGYFAGLLRVLRHESVVEEAPLPPPDRRDPRTTLEGDWALAPCGGFLENLVEPGALVEAGHPLALIRSPLGEVIARLNADKAGIVMGVRHLASIQPGEWATCVVQDVPL